MTSAKGILFQCIGNSARSILAEWLLRHLCAGRCNAHSAVSKPAGEPHRVAMRTLEARGIAHEFAISRNSTEFAVADAAAMDIIMTFCPGAAAETCPLWPGNPDTVHWPLGEPACAEGSDLEVLAALAETFEKTRRRIEALLALGGMS